MAKNDPVGDNARRGAVRDRSQVFNPANQMWSKRDTGNGQMNVAPATRDFLKAASFLVRQ